MPQGYNASGDILTQTADGRDLNALWSEFQSTITILNSERQTLIDLLTFNVTQNIEDVPQIGGDDFEEASEFGEPHGVRPRLNYFSLGYTFKWYDLAARFTWQFLADATAPQVEAVHQSALEADNRNIFVQVMTALFDNHNRTATINGQGYNVYALFNNDGTVPPAYKGNTFAGTHTHYVTSGHALVDSDDLDQLITLLAEHGYTAASGVSMILLVNPQEGRAIRRFRANLENNNAAVATYDFIPSVGSAPFFGSVPGTQLVGSQPANSYKGLTVIGAYGPLTIIEEDYIPAGYMVIVGSGGPSSLQNPVGFREHANTSYRGMRLIPGNDNAYPLKDSFYVRGFGTGIRQRGGSAVMQVTTSGSYTSPVQYTR